MDGQTEHIRDMRLKNPCVLPDPESGLYYLYHATEPDEEGGRGLVLVQTSRDLIEWSAPAPALAEGSEFRGTPDIRSPRVYAWGGGYLLLVSVRYETAVWSCQCFRAERPTGPFLAFGGPLTSPEESSTDGALLLDRRARPWLVYGRLPMQEGDDEICAVPLTEDCREAQGDAIVLFSAADATWGQAELSEDGRHFRRAARSPWPHRSTDGSLIMLWTGDSRTGSAVGCARSPSGRTAGPWEIDAEPLFGMDGGGACLFPDLGGRLLMALYAPSAGEDSRLLIHEIEEIDGRLEIVNEITGNWYYNAYREDGSMKAAKH